MTLIEYTQSLNEKQLKAYAKAAGTTLSHLRINLLSDPPRKIPREPLMRGLAKASKGKVSYEEVLNHFYRFKGAAGS